MNNTTSNCSITVDRAITLFGYIFVFLVGTIGNIIVLIVFRRYWRKGPIMELLILYLAVCDLLSSIITPTVFGYWVVTCDRWDFGYATCKIFPPLCRIFNNCSVGFILIMALNRFRAIVTPFKRKISRNVIHVAAFITVFASIVWESYYVRVLEIAIYDNIPYCDISDTDEPSYAYPSIILVLIRDVGFLLIFFVSTFVAWMAIRKSDYHVFVGKRKERISKRSKTIGRMLVFMAIVFVLSMFPRDLYLLAYQFSGYVGSPIEYSNVMLLVNSSLKL